MGRSLLLLSILLMLLSSGREAIAVDFDSEILPILETVCVDCHGPETAKADIRLDTLNPDFLRGGDADTWHDALDQINLGDMPPSKAEVQLTDDQRQVLTGWLNESLNAVAAAKRNAGGRIETRRLTRYEYANTMRDLLGVELDYARELPPEPTSPEGFLNDGSTLEMSPTQMETYLAVARQAMEVAIVSGDKPTVIQEVASETAVGKLPRRKDGGADPVNPEFVLDIPEFPRTGEFELVIRAGATVPEGQDFPRMRASMGCVPGIVHVPRKVIDEVDVTASPDDPQTFVLRGRMEDYPQAGETRFGANVDFNGVIVMLDFLDADGNELRYPHSWYSDPPPKPKKKGEPAPQLEPRPEEPFLDIVIKEVRFTAPTVTAWPPQSHVALLGEGAIGKPEPKRARSAIATFLPRAFRRPVSESEIDRFFALYQTIRPRSGSFEEAMRETLAAILISPHFLNLVNTRDDFATANRLSYFLWSTMPDDRLMELAAQGELMNPEVVAAEVDRLLNDPRAEEFAHRFADQWFDLGGLDRVAINPEYFPEFDNELKTAMQMETRAFFADILQGDLSCLELLDSNWTVVNRALAKHYGLSTRPRSGAFERISLSEADQRGGVLGQGAFLLANSNGESSHPIKRAVWILDRLLDSPPAPPPPDVPDLDAESPDLAGLTLKEQLALHREKSACNSCHENIDPWGIALENFDATGLYRTTAPVPVPTKNQPAGKGPRLDPVTQLPNGEQLTGVEDLKRYLLEERREHFARAVTRRMATYALGRSLDLGDREAIEELTANFMADDFRLRSLITDLTSSDLFLNN